MLNAINPALVSRSFVRSILSVAFIMISVSVRAESPSAVQFGGEFTFTNEEVIAGQIDPLSVDSEVSLKFQDLLVKRARASCGDCQVIQSENGYGVPVYKILYPDGFYFVIATDPSVIEVQTKPSTNDEIKANVDRLNRDLFATAAALNLRPSPRVGGGHIHFGFSSSTGGELLMTRNIIVDFANHPELANGIFSVSKFNAPPLASLPADRQAAFKRIIADVDSGKIRSIKTLITRIHKEVYDYHIANWTPPEKYHDLNLVRILSDSFGIDAKTFENRFYLAQNNAEEFEMQTRLIEGRVQYLRKSLLPIPVDIPRFLSESEKYKRFARYVFESGVDFEEFRKKVKLVNPVLARSTPAFVPSVLCKNLFLAH